jgi:sorting nexin-8
MNSQLQRTMTILNSIWHELRVVLHNREHALVTQALQDFAREEQGFSKSVASIWTALSDELGNMPLE